MGDYISYGIPPTLGLEIIHVALKWTPSDPRDVIDLYLSGVSENLVSKRFNTSRSVIRRILLENGVTPRSQSEAEFVKWSRMDRKSRMRQVRAAHDAVRGKPHTQEHRVSIAQSREQRVTHASAYEATVQQWLLDRGVVPVPQKAVGPYNCDLALHPIAVEIFGGGWHMAGRHAERLPERTRYFLDAGWHMLIVSVGRNHLRLTEAVADYAVRWLEEARRNPTVPREYRVIWGTGEVVSSGRLNGDQLTAVPTLSRTHHKRRRRN